MYDIIIIGGGISSLYFTYNIIKKYKELKILIIESNNRLGGRVYTSKINNNFIELGAGRFSDSDILLIKLLDDFNLTNNIIKNSNKISNYVNYKKKNINEKLSNILINKAVNNCHNDELYKYNIYNILKKNLNKKELNNILNTTPYIGEYYLQNAYDFLNKNLKSFNKNQYYSVKNGLSQLINRLALYLNNFVDIKLNEKCLKIKKKDTSYIIETDKTIYKTNKLIIALSPYDAENILGLLKKPCFINIFNKINPLPLNRIYAIYPIINGKCWFSNLNRIITNSPLQTIIPLNKEKGLIMISYTDYYNAININIQTNKLNFIQKELKKLFPKLNIPEPIKIISCFWYNGVNYWKPGYCYIKDYKTSIQPMKNIYLIGDSYSNKQGWIEGALQSAKYTSEIF